MLPDTGRMGNRIKKGRCRSDFAPRQRLFYFEFFLHLQTA